MFVASNLPPKPVSSSRKSALYFENIKNAAAVVISKNVIGLFLLIFFYMFR